jgi:pyruvate dehydrogenase E2 component (dihydrolipoamide acetyltransferase)
MPAQVFSMPDVGEGLTEAEILRWLVRPGDTVAVNQMIVEIETAKAAVELPCPFAGVVEELHATEGTVVLVGSPIISITSDAKTPSAEPQRQAVLVGYGVREGGVPTRRRRRDTGTEAGAPTTAPTSTAGAPARQVARAKPLVRKLAREKGIDLTTIAPTGLHGEVTRADVVNAIGGEVSQPSVSNDSAGERIPVRGVQRAMAEAMVQSAFTAPHVTEWVDVDMTRTMEVVRRLREAPASKDVRITPMILVAAGLIRAARQHPRINSTWVDTNDGADVVLHRDVHLGIAADTPRGLLVPTIKGASSLGLVELARRVQALIDTARAGRSTPADLTGGTITLTNVGVFGVDGGTPIINPGQTSILAMGRVIDRPWVVDGRIEVRPVMELSVSFDHRVIDGGIGSRALQSIAAFLQDPAMAVMMETGLN